MNAFKSETQVYRLLNYTTALSLTEPPKPVVLQGYTDPAREARCEQ